MQALKKLNPYFGKHKWLLIAGAFFVIISVIFKLFPALFIRNSFDAIAVIIENDRNGVAQDGNVSGELVRYGLYIIGAAVLQGIFMYFMRQTIVVMSRHIEFDLKNTVFEHYQRLTQRFYKNNSTGDLMNRISEDVSKVRMYVGPAIMYALNTGFTIILVISIMISVSPKLTLLTLVPLPFLAFLVYRVANLIHTRSRRVQEQLSELSTFAQESFSGARVIKAYHKSPWFSANFKAQAIEYRSVNERLFRVNATFQPLMILMVGISTLITIYVGGRLYFAGQVSAGNITEFIYYVNLLTWPIASIGWVTSLVQSADASMQRLDEFLKEQPEFSNGSHKPTSFDAGSGDEERLQAGVARPRVGVVVTDQQIRRHRGEFPEDEQRQQVIAQHETAHRPGEDRHQPGEATDPGFAHAEVAEGVGAHREPDHRHQQQHHCGEGIGTQFESEIETADPTD